MKRIVVLVGLICLFAAGCAGDETAEGSRTDGGSPGGATAETTEASGPSSGLRTVAIDASGGDEVEVRVEIADDEEERAKGLMDRTSLGEDRGMLFVFPDEQVRSFWMRDTLIPLSIAYMDSDGRIVDIQDMEPRDDDPPQYVSAEPAQYALEVNQGFFEERGVEVGDRAELPE